MSEIDGAKVIGGYGADIPDEELRTMIAEDIDGAIYTAVRAAVEAEREAAARIAESHIIPGHSVQAPSCLAIATAIRARGEG